MLRIKRLYTFIIQTFVPVFIMTFAICLFIVLMQFIWRYVEDLVGKGLENSVLAEMFLYAALQLIPMALPLSLLLASLMAFGSLGERLELLSIKAAGVSLLKAMRPLIILVAAIAIGGFFFQNEAMPRINVKLRSLLMSIKQKSPELDIPEGSFYGGIRNYSLYVKKKNPKTKYLYDVLIYDTSKGFDNMLVIACDSALMRVSEDKKFLVLNLHTGQQFTNLKDGQISTTSSSYSDSNKPVPYSRESFIEKEVIIAFDSGFDRIEESNLEGTYISKNILELSNSIDSLTTRLDSANMQDRKLIGTLTYLTYRSTEQYKATLNNDTLKSSISQEEFPEKIDFDSLLNSFSKNEMKQYFSMASMESENSRNVNSMDNVMKQTLQKNIRMHKIERHRKFVLSFACLIFFFIGAPLGAIIRKGGLGMPVVVSVLLFIIYYIIDNVGYKMARDGVWEVWQGMWLSSFALFPLGVFLTYKAMNDSALFNPDAYVRFFNKILFIKTPAAMTDEQKAEMISKIPALSSIHIESETLGKVQEMDNDKLRNLVDNYKEYDYDQSAQLAALSILKEKGADIGDILEKQDYKSAEELLNSYKENSLYTNIVYVLVVLVYLLGILFSVSFSKWIFIAYLLLYIRSFIYYFSFYKKVEKQSQKYHAAVLISSLICYPLGYHFAYKKMQEGLNKIKSIIHL